MANGAPSPFLLMLEPQRALLEAMTLPISGPLLDGAPRGNGQPVLVLPGFTAGDGSTQVLRRFLASKDFSPHPWLLGRNRGPVGDMREKLVARVFELAERYEEPIQIVGWSLGGIYARELAKQLPTSVRQVVTLGSPFADVGRESNATALYRRSTGARRSMPRNEVADELRKPPTVPSTAIFTRTDGVVHWAACLEPETDHTENIEVPGSHCGLGMNPLVLYAVADRLSQPAGTFAPFNPHGWRGHLYGNTPPADLN